MNTKFGKVKKLKNVPFVCIHKDTWRKVVSRMRSAESNLKQMKRIMSKWDI